MTECVSTEMTITRKVFSKVLVLSDGKLFWSKKVPTDFFNRVKVGYKVKLIRDKDDILEISGFKNHIGEFKRVQLIFD
jgi:ABC-type methionine transport system ATPase subunit